jgi:DHA2 family multidrug resistance protein
MAWRGALSPFSDRRLATVALMVATGMQAGDATIVNVALNQIEEELGGGLLLTAWVMTSYLCANAVFAPLTGPLRRRYGLRHVFVAAVALFVVASLGCALSPSAAVLIGFRIVQGAAGGLLHPMTQAMLLDLYPREQHGRMLGIWGAATMLGPILGPVLGGIATDLASWRLAFTINVPLGILALYGTWGLLRRPEAFEKVPIDGLGLVLLIIGIGSLQLFLTREIGHSRFDSPELIAEIVIAAIAVIWTVLRTRNSGTVILRLDMLADRNFAAAAFYNFMTSALLFTALVFIPALAEGPLGYPATIAGATIVPRAALMMLIMVLAGRIIGRIDYRVLLSAGWILMAIGLLLLSRTAPPNEFVWMIAGSTVQAIGAGTLFTPLSSAAFSTLEPDRRTDAAGLYSLLRQLGCACGVALMSAVLRGRVNADTAAILGGGGGQLTIQEAAAVSLGAYDYCFEVMGFVAVIAAPGVLVFRGGAVSAPATKLSADPLEAGEDE